MTALLMRQDPFEGFFRNLTRPVTPYPAAMRVDVREDATAYTIRADLPGVNKDDIHVSVDGERVTVSAETRSENEVKDSETVLRRERHAGTVSRTFALGQPVDDAQATAKYVDGVLELTLPKKAPATVRRLTIQ